MAVVSNEYQNVQLMSQQNQYTAGTVRIDIQSQEVGNPPTVALVSHVLTNQHHETPAYQVVPQQHNAGSPVADMLSLEQMLDVVMAGETGSSSEAVRALNNPQASEPHPRTLHNPQEPKSLLRIGNTYLEKISHWILITGGVTFIASNTASILFSIVTFFEMDWAVYTVLKMECLLSHLAWHWISYDEHLRMTTDAMFISLVKKIFSFWVWPLSVNSWAEQL